MECSCLLVCACGEFWLYKHELCHLVPVLHRAGEDAQPANAFAAPSAPSTLRNPFCPTELGSHLDSLQLSQCLPSTSSRCSHVPRTPQTTGQQSERTLLPNLLLLFHLPPQQGPSRSPDPLPHPEPLPSPPSPGQCPAPPLHRLCHRFGLHYRSLGCSAVS